MAGHDPRRNIFSYGGVFCLCAITQKHHKMAVLPQQTPRKALGGDCKLHPQVLVNNFRFLSFSLPFTLPTPRGGKLQLILPFA